MRGGKWGPALVLAMGCSGASSTTPVADSRLVVSGNDMGPQAENLILVRGGEPVRGATVTVNGVELAETLPGQYQGQLPDSVPAGGTIQLQIYAGVDTASGTATVPGAPAITTPTINTTILLGQTLPPPVAFTWTSPSSPDEFLFGLDYDPAEGLAEIDSVTGTARSGSVPTSTIPVGTTQVIAFLIAYSNGTFSANVHPASRMHVRQSAPQVNIIPATAN